MTKEDLNRWIVWVEPFSNFCTVPIYMKMLGSDIAQAYKATNLCPLMTDEEALEKFMIVMWASFEKEDHGNL